jgi:hypothetical protein
MATEPAVDWAPDSCTLPTAERPLRADEFSELFATALLSLERVDRRHLRLTLTGDDDLLPVVAGLTAREAECCAFFDFAITRTDEAILLDIAVPDAYVDVLDGLAQHARSAAGTPR